MNNIKVATEATFIVINNKGAVMRPYSILNPCLFYFDLNAL